MAPALTATSQNTAYAVLSSAWGVLSSAWSATKSYSGSLVGGRRTAISILGMHRSGTSAVTQLVSLLGASLPRNLVPPGRHNVRGYWEPARLVKLHDRLLSDGGSAWDDWYPFDLESISPRLLSYYRRQISKIIAEEYGADPLLVIKDPRICRFVMLYDEVLAQLSINRYFVLPYRHPSSVISSLFARYRMAPDHAALIPDCTIDNSARAKIANVNRDIEKSAGDVGVPEISAQQIGRPDVCIDKHRISEIGAMHLRLIEDGASEIGARHLSIVDRDPLRPTFPR